MNNGTAVTKDKNITMGCEHSFIRDYFPMNKNDYDFHFKDGGQFYNIKCADNECKNKGQFPRKKMPNDVLYGYFCKFASRKEACKIVYCVDCRNKRCEREMEKMGGKNRRGVRQRSRTIRDRD